MLLLIRFSDGSVRSAVLLAVIGGRLRVALPDCGDVAEYRLAGEQWRAENGQPVDIDFDPARDDFERHARPSAKASCDPDEGLCYPAPAPFPSCPNYVN